jgi:hypothetical protein
MEAVHGGVVVVLVPTNNVCCHRVGGSCMLTCVYGGYGGTVDSEVCDEEKMSR